jgi:hypothetical protein
MGLVIPNPKCFCLYFLLTFNILYCVLEFCYSVCGQPERYLEEPEIHLISTVNFYYLINKL